MGQFGQELRREREARGVAIESISGVTKISGRHLTALEEENFAALPGGVLNKGIVRGYARACGLDEDTWLRRYTSAYAESGQVKDDDQAWIDFAENTGKGRQGDPRDSTIDPDLRLRWAGVAALLVVLALFAWYVVRFVEARTVGELAAPPAATALVTGLFSPQHPGGVRSGSAQR